MAESGAVRGTELFERTLAFSHGDAELDKLMRDVWTPTPWMVDVYTDRVNSDTHRSMMEWCRDHFGDECWPIHGRLGAWQSGSATVHGWTWFGFATKENLNQFLAAFPVHPLPQEDDR